MSSEFWYALTRRIAAERARAGTLTAQEDVPGWYTMRWQRLLYLECALPYYYVRAGIREGKTGPPCCGQPRALVLRPRRRAGVECRVCGDGVADARVWGTPRQRAGYYTA